MGEKRSYCWGLGWKRGLSYCPTSSSLPQGSLPRAPHRPPPAPSRHLGLPSLIRLRRDPLDMGGQRSGEVPHAATWEPTRSHWGKDGVTHRILDPREVHICLLQPVVEVLSVVRGVALAVGGHAEHCQGVLDLWQAAQVSLGRQGQGPGPAAMTQPL